MNDKIADILMSGLEITPKQAPRPNINTTSYIEHELYFQKYGKYPTETTDLNSVEDISDRAMEIHDRLLR